MRYLHIILLVSILTGLDSVASAQTFEKVGDIGQIAIPTAGFLVATVKKDRNGAIELMGSVLLTQAIVQAMKATIETTRPNGKSGSFPSGHTAVAFTGASFLQKRYGWRYGLPAYAGAAIVGASRVQSRNHYLRDVAVGAAIGLGVGQLLTRPIGKRIKVAPSFNGGIGFTASIDLE